MYILYIIIFDIGWSCVFGPMMDNEKLKLKLINIYPLTHIKFYNTLIIIDTGGILP